MLNVICSAGSAYLCLQPHGITLLLRAVVIDRHWGRHSRALVILALLGVPALPLQGEWLWPYRNCCSWSVWIGISVVPSRIFPLSTAATSLWVPLKLPASTPAFPPPFITFLFFPHLDLLPHQWNWGFKWLLMDYGRYLNERLVKCLLWAGSWGVRNVMRGSTLLTRIYPSDYPYKVWNVFYIT